MSVAPAYLCDACRAVAHQVPKAFEAELVKLGSSKLGEVGVFEAIEAACNAGMVGYGTKSVGAGAHEKVLSGEGTPGHRLPGPHFGDAGWDHRMSRFCKALVGDVGEEEVYAEFAEGRNMTEQLCAQHTRHCRHKPRVAARRAVGTASEAAAPRQAKQQQQQQQQQQKKHHQKKDPKLSDARGTAAAEPGSCAGMAPLQATVQAQADEIARLSAAERRLQTTVERLELILARVERTQNAVRATVCGPDSTMGDTRLCKHGVDIVQNLNVKLA